MTLQPQAESREGTPVGENAAAHLTTGASSAAEKRETMNGAKWNPACLALGGVGAALGVVADLTSKGSSATVLRVRDAVNTYAGISIETIYVMAVFVLLGVILTFASQVDDLKKAIYIGASIITMFMTIIPNELPPSVGGGTQPGVSGGTGLLELLGIGRAYAQPVAADARRGVVELTLNATDGKKLAEVVLTIRSREDGRSLGRSKYTSDRIEFSQDSGTYVLVVEASGYEVETTEVEVTNGRTSRVEVALRSTWKPLFLQRIFRSK